MKDMGEIAKANEVARKARRKEEEEAKEAAAREVLAKRRGVQDVGCLKEVIDRQKVVLDD